LKQEELLIYFLLEQEDYVTATQISQVLDLSTKTIYRMIKKINDRSKDQDLIKTEKGKGIRLDYELYLKSKQDYIQSNIQIYSPIERRMNIIQELLFQSPNGVDREMLFKNYYVSSSVIRSDEEFIAATLKNIGLVLKRDGGKLLIEGEETQIRKALIDSLLKSNILNYEDLKTINDGFKKEDFKFVINQIEMLEHTFGIIIPYPYNINLLTHMYILIKRTGQGVYDLSEHPKIVANSIIPKDEEKYYPMAVKITGNIAKYLDAPIPKSETLNILIYLTSSRIDRSGEKPRTFPNEVVEITNFFIEEFKKESNFEITPSLIFEELASHIKPMINRLRNEITLKNNLIEDIKLEYRNVFNTLSKISKKVSDIWELPIISADEIGFISLYFARDIEQQPQKIRALLVCTTGMGTSELLKVKLMKSFPDIEVQSTMSIKQCSTEFIEANDVDLVLSTVKMNDELQVPIVLVSSLLIQKDQDNVKSAIKEILWNRQKRAI